MSKMMITPEDITKILQKKYNKPIDEETKKEIDNFIIESEISRFNENFNKVFDENLLPSEENLDLEDGTVNEIGIKIIESIKESLEKVNKEKLLKLLFKLITKLVFGNQDSED